MLNQLRRGAQGWVAKVFLGALAASFIGWGVADVLRNPGAGSRVLTAGDTDVSVLEYQAAYRQGLNRLAQQLQRRPNAEEAEMRGVDQAVLSQLTAGALLDEQARSVGIDMTDEGLVKLIQQEPAFKDQGGTFSRSAMRSALSNAQMTEAMYLDDLRRSASRNQLIASVSDGASIPKVFVDALGRYTGERRTVNYVRLQPQGIDSIEDPSAEALHDFYTEHQDSYRAPEYRGFSYVLLSPSALADPAIIPDADVATYYEANKARFTTPERRQVSQVVFPDRAAADAAAAAIAGGTSLEDAATAAGRQVTDLGLIPRTAIPNAVLADAAFSAALNTPTPVVDGPFGPVILSVSAISPEVVKPLDEVRDEVQKSLATEAANTKITGLYRSVSDALESGASLEEAAGQAGTVVKSVEPVDRNGSTRAGVQVADLPSPASVLQAVFNADEGSDPTPVNFDGNSYVFLDLGEIVPSRDRPLDEVRERVVNEWKDDEAQRLLEERAKALSDRVRSGESLADMAKVEGLTVETAAAITRESGREAIGEAGTRAAFSGPQGTVANAPALSSGEAIVLQVAEISEPVDPLANVADQTREGLNAVVREDLFQSYVAFLQKEIPVSYNTATINQAKVNAR